MDAKKYVYWMPIVLSIVALPLAIASFYFTVTDDPPVVYEAGSLTGDESAEIASRALEKAEQNNEVAGTILSLLEGGSVLLTIIVAAVAGIYTLNLRDLREDLEGKADANQEKIDNALALRAAELDKLTLELTQQAEQSKAQVNDLTQMIVEQLEDARQRAENSFRVLTLQQLVDQQVQSRNYDMAIAMLQEAHDLEPDNQSTNYLLGYLYISKKRFQEALDYLQRVFEVDPNFAPALAAMGLAQSRLGRQIEDPQTRNGYWAQAEVNLIKALDKDPGMIDADGESYYGTLGGLYRRQERHADAMRAYEKAVEVTPHSSYPVGNLAVLYQYLGEVDKAQGMFARVEQIVGKIIQDRPGDYWARLDLAQALLIQGKTEAAFAQYDEIIGRKTPSTALSSAISTLEFLANASLPIKGLTEAINKLQTAISKYQTQG